MPKYRGKTPSKAERDAADMRLLQVDLEEDIAVAEQEARRGPISGEGATDTSEPLERLPESCPACGAGIQQGRADIFTHMGNHTHRSVFLIQCGQCGKTLHCTEAVWLEVRRIRQDFHARFAKVTKYREKRERGTE